MKRFVLSVIVLALLAVVVNDGGRYLRSYSDLNLETKNLASWATINARDLAAQEAFNALAQRAEPKGVAIVRYDSDGHRFQFSTQTNVSGTWVVGTVMAMRQGVPLREARNTPIAIYRNVEATFQ